MADGREEGRAGLIVCVPKVWINQAGHRNGLRQNRSFHLTIPEYNKKEAHCERASLYGAFLQTAGCLHYRLRLDEQHPCQAYGQNEFYGKGKPGVQPQNERAVQTEGGGQHQ